MPILNAVTVMFVVLMVVALLLGLPLMLLWNWLMPGLFHLPELGFWQAVGMNLLSGILFRSSTATSNKN